MQPSSTSAQFGEPRSAFLRSLLASLRRPTTYVLMTAGILLLDFLTGRYLMFPILYVFPVACAAWFYSARWAYGLAVVLPVGRFCIAAFVEMPFPFAFVIINAFIRMAVLVSFAFLVARVAQQRKELQRELRLLEGILPICMYCKRIRDDHQSWQQLEVYISARSDTSFSHGLCPDCAREHYGDLLERK
jgi:hypothetical protein